jgi:tRNA threonylcarbamoyladenosine biosynthesis protein TsaE
MELADLHATEQLARVIAACLRPGDAVLLAGPLGAGKTAFARALLRQACGDPLLEVPSPSFTLVQTYTAPQFTLHHFDLWRLDGPAALEELGWDDARRDVVVVEWPDRLGDRAPPDALTINLAPARGEAREATLTGWEARLRG